MTTPIPPGIYAVPVEHIYAELARYIRGELSIPDSERGRIIIAQIESLDPETFALLQRAPAD